MEKTRNPIFIGELPNYYCRDYNWTIYAEKLEAYFLLNQVTDNEKLALLITGVCPEIYESIHIICYPDKYTEKSYDEIFYILNGQYLKSTTSSVFLHRKMFYKAKQESKETVLSWLQRIKGLSIGCQFGDNFCSVIIDRFISGLRSSGILIEQCGKLTLDQAVLLALKASNEYAY